VKRFVALAALLLGLRFACTSSSTDSRPLRIATFNIEDFPKDARQIDGAFAEIAALDAPIVGVQEIMDPRAFISAMGNVLGGSWQVAFEPFVELGYRHTGVLFDRTRFELLETTTHDETMLGGDHKRVLDVRLKPLAEEDGRRPIRVLVVHLKAGGDGRDIRAEQHAALRRIVETVNRSRDRVVVLGDFNATHDVEDRADLARLASTTGLEWATEPLACSAFWRREDDCPRSRLDHVLTWKPGVATVAGACATTGCDWQNSCPVYSREISDHCPVVVELR
jgi:endonuclease/exonuclease/phosphatase family metal-dependent hydrolase